MNTKLLRDKINQYESICIFRHAKPDGDAVGSQLGLMTYLKNNFPNKQVYALGNDVFDKFPIVDVVEDCLINKSLCIVLDTANKERVDDQRFINGDYIIKIDHHPIVDSFGDMNIESPLSAATCELITDILISDDFIDLKIDDKVASFLYSGLLTDTLSFKTSNTTANTLKVAYELVKNGADPYYVSHNMFDKHRKDFDFCSYMRSKMIYDDGIAYVLLNAKDLEECNMKANEAKNYVAELGGVIEHEIWCIFTENDQGGYDGSLRSKKEYVINDIASQFNGGGHLNACGVKNLSIDQVTIILEKLKTRINAIKANI